MTFKTKDENIAAVLYGAHDLRVEKRPIPQPQAGEVLLRIKATGICGSDLHYYLDGGLGPRRIDSSKPMILGHESAGIVVSIGDDTTKLKVGDRVVIEPGRSCGVCSYCCQGRYNLCPKMKFSSSLLQGPNDGSLCRYACFPENLCHRLPDNMSFDDGALIEPLAVALHSVERTPIKVGSTVHVFGAGPVGLLTAAVAFVKGAVNCTIFDINQDRLDFAKKYLPNGVRVVLLPKIKFQNAEDTITWAQDNAIHFLRDLSNDDSDNFADVVFECTGVAECIMLSMYVVQRGGTVMLIGLGRDKTLMPTDIITTREVDIRGNFRYANVHKKAITLVEQGRINLSSLVSHRFKLENSVNAFELAKNGGNGIIKIIITDIK